MSSSVLKSAGETRTSCSRTETSMRAAVSAVPSLSGFERANVSINVLLPGGVHRR